MRGRKTAANCESCMNYEYDDDYECYVCTQDLDEDEMVRFVQGDFRECPYYQVGDEYRVVSREKVPLNSFCIVTGAGSTAQIRWNVSNLDAHIAQRGSMRSE